MAGKRPTPYAPAGVSSGVSTACTPFLRYVKGVLGLVFGRRDTKGKFRAQRCFQIKTLCQCQVLRYSQQLERQSELEHIKSTEQDQSFAVRIDLKRAGNNSQ